MEYKDYIRNQKELYSKGFKRVHSNRERWDELEARATVIFEKIIKEAKTQQFFDSLYIFNYKDFTGGKKTNQHFISLQMGKHPMGIQVIKKDGRENSIETGGALVIAQGPQGEVYITAYPCESNEFKIKSGNLVLGIYTSPAKLTNEKLYSAIKNFFWYSFISSYIGKITVRDVIKIKWIKFRVDLDIFKLGKLFSSALKEAISLGANINGLPSKT